MLNGRAATRSPVIDTPVKAAERIARQIVEDISGGTVVPGETLATEASMLKTFKVSRGTLREALRLMEIQGLVVLKSGPSGGPVLARPDPLFAGRMLTLFLRLSG